MDDAFAVLVKSLHDTLKVSMTNSESLARECAEMAAIAEQDGNRGMADVLRHLGRSHRIKALELTGKLALLEEQHPNFLRPET